MATYVDKVTPGARTTTSGFSSLFGSTARKYTTANAVRNNSASNSTTNSEHILTLGNSLQTLSLSAAAVAAQARTQMQAANAQLRAVTGSKTTVPQSRVVYTEAEVNDDQRKFAAIAPVGNIVNPVLRTQVKDRLLTYVANSRYVFTPAKVEDAKIGINQAVPDVEEVYTDFDENKSSVDGFFVKIVYNIPYSELGKLKAIRIFRAEDENPQYTRPLATLSPTGMQRLATLRGRKNEDFSQCQMAMEQAGVPNAVTNLNYFDPYTGLRVSADGSASLQVAPALAGGKITIDRYYAQVPAGLAHLDRSVLNNINVLSNIQRNPVYGYTPTVDTHYVTVGNQVNLGTKLGIKHQQEIVANRTSGSLTRAGVNQLGFKEVAFVPVDSSLKVKRIGDYAEFTFVDESVAYGHGYKYFIMTVDPRLLQSARSQIVAAVVEGLRIPEMPASVVTTIDQNRVGLVITAQDQLIEKFEVHRFEATVDRATSAAATTVADAQGFTVTSQDRTLGDNNFLLIGECQNGMQTGGQFMDKGVSPGRQYTYRVYSVDIFGNKSERPFEIDAYVPDMEQQFVHLISPSVMAEVDSTTAKMRVTMLNQDPNIVALKVERRDLTLGQDAFSTPGSPPRIVLGRGRYAVGRKGLEGERMYDGSIDRVWNGVLPAPTGSQQIFIDTTVAVDHIYQYRVWGEDTYGNRSSYALTSPLLVIRRPFINTPTGLRTALTTQSDQTIAGVKFSWVEGNLDKSAEDLIGNQAALSESQVRTLYQVQRLKVGEDKWRNFPLMTGTVLYDLVKGVEADVAPNYRPPYLELNQTYMYRVQAIQTGAFISNFSEPVSIFMGNTVYQPLNFVLRTPPVQRRPFYVMLNWDTFSGSGVVDRWEIQRADVNNFAAARLNTNNVTDYDNLTFRPLTVVYREASRFRGKVQDDYLATRGTTGIITGQHHYMDTRVDFGNTYFYRIRAVTPQGVTSKWSYKGVKLTSTIFEKKWYTVLTEVEKRLLTLSYQPMTVAKGKTTVAKSSLSLIPEYAKPLSQRTTPRVVYSMGVSVR